MGPDKAEIISNDEIRFVLDGDIVTASDIDPTRTILQYLREDLGYTGTKEGCAEGDCGACTVVLGELDANRKLRLRAVNSCIQFLPTLDGKQLIPVESLSPPGGPLHPVQKAVVDCHGSQCGFCTPGFVMSLFALYKSKCAPTRRDIDDALAGNLCRCTGYRPIIDAAQKMYSYKATTASWLERPFQQDAEVTDEDRRLVDMLISLQRDRFLQLQGSGSRFFAPISLAELAKLAAEHQQAHILAGGTDVGLWVTKHLKELDTIIYIGKVDELSKIIVDEDCIEIGAGVALTDTMPVLSQYYPDLDELFKRFASPPIRNAGTLGGNIANGSPIGDSMPALIALGANIVLANKDAVREIALDQFYIDYEKNDIQPGEVLVSVRIPLPRPGYQVRSYKISKRFDQDISAVCGAYCISLDGDTVADIRICYGGVAAIPKRAVACEQVLIGKLWNEPSLQNAVIALAHDFQPITDMRASSRYREKLIGNLLYKFFLETSGFTRQQTRVYCYGR